MTPALRVTRRGLVAAGVAVLALVQSASLHPGPALTPAAAQRLLDYTPRTGATFNRPVGSSAEQRAIFTHVNGAVDAAPPGATVRFAVFSFSESLTADKLIAAYERGVNVQVIFNAHEVYGAESRLVAALGSNPDARSFALFCAGSCRGTTGMMHQKVFLFSRAGSADNVVMVGSNNMTRNNAVNQWSDIFTVVGDPALYFTYSGVFEQMKYDVPQAQPYIRAQVNGYQPEFYPRPGTTQADDPVYAALSRIGCRGAGDGYGTPRQPVGKRTVRVTRVRVSQHAWNGDRGIYLAGKVADLARAGCDVRVIYGVGTGRVVKNVLDQAGVKMSGGTAAGVRTHQKLFSVSGMYDGDPTSAIVWTGSHNWSDGALKRDDVVLRIDSPDVYAQYLANFKDIWRNG